MGFGSRELDRAFDNWVTRTPEEAGYYEQYCDLCDKPLDECKCEGKIKDD